MRKGREGEGEAKTFWKCPSKLTNYIPYKPNFKTKNPGTKQSPGRT